MKNVDYMLKENEQEALIEVEKQQEITREEVISMYKECRKELGLTQMQLGKRAGISQPNVTRFESGTYNPSLEFMVKIAAALGKKVKVTLED